MKSSPSSHCTEIQKENHTPTFGSLARKKLAEDWLPKPSILHPWPSGSPSGVQARSRMPLCAVIVITARYDTEEASADLEGRGIQSLSPMRNGEMSMMCLTDVN